MGLELRVAVTSVGLGLRIEVRSWADLWCLVLF